MLGLCRRVVVVHFQLQELAYEQDQLLVWLVVLDPGPPYKFFVPLQKPIVLHQTLDELLRYDRIYLGILAIRHLEAILLCHHKEYVLGQVLLVIQNSIYVQVDGVADLV